MKIKPGDICRLINVQHPCNMDKLVVVARRSKRRELMDGLPVNVSEDLEWLIESLGSPIYWTNEDGRQFATPWAFCRSNNLQPIRDQDGEDEMLRIAGKPKEKETT